MIPEDWAQLKVLPLNIHQDTGSASNFDSLVEGRAPCQEIQRRQEQEAHMRAEMDDVFER